MATIRIEGSALRRARERSALSLSEVSYQLRQRYGIRITAQGLCNIENNESRPRADVVEALLDLYRVKRSDVVRKG